MEQVPDLSPKEKLRTPVPPPGWENNFAVKALENLKEKLEQKADQLEAELEASEEDFLYDRGERTPFHNLSSITVPPAWDINYLHGYTSWLDTFMTAEGLKQLVTADAVEMDHDPRIRPFTVKELQAVRTYFTLGQVCFKKSV